MGETSTDMQTNIKEFVGNEEEFNNMYKEVKEISCIIFHAPWCRSCMRLLQLLPTCAGKFPKTTFFTVNVDKSKEFAKRFNVTMVPSTKIIKCEDGTAKEIDGVSGSNLDLVCEKLNNFKC